MAETKIKPVESFEYGGCSYSKGPDGAVKFSDVWEGACGDKAVSAYQKVIEDQLKLIDFFEKNSKSLKSAIRRAGARCVDVPTLLGNFPVDVGGRRIPGVYRVKGVETGASGKRYELILLDFRDSQNARIDEIQVRKVTYLNEKRADGSICNAGFCSEPIIQVGGKGFEDLTDQLLSLGLEACFVE